MTTQEAWNRGNNLVATAVCVLAGVSFLPELFVEDEVQFKVDDALLFICGMVALWWYRKAKNRFSTSVMPLIFVGSCLAIKIFGLIMEIKDKEDVGDDFGGLILFICAAILVIYLRRQKVKIN